MPELRHAGGCLCGGVRYEIDGALGPAAYCHCTRCQRRSGTAASPQARAPRGGVRVVDGEQLIREWDPGDGGWPKCFCSVCGGALWSRDPSDPALRSVRLGTFDADPGVRPAWRQYVAYAAPWEDIPDDGLPRYPEARPKD